MLVKWDSKRTDPYPNAPLWKYPLETPTYGKEKKKGTYLYVQDSCLKEAGLGLFATQDIPHNVFLDVYGSFYVADPCFLFTKEGQRIERSKRFTFASSEEKYIVNLPNQKLLLEAHNPNDIHPNLFYMDIQQSTIVWKRWNACSCPVEQTQPLLRECFVFIFPKKTGKDVLLDTFALYANDSYRSYDLLEEKGFSSHSESTANAALMVVSFSCDLLRECFQLTCPSPGGIFKVFLISLTTIRKDEEIFVSYGKNYWDEEHVVTSIQRYPKIVYSKFIQKIVQKLGGKPTLTFPCTEEEAKTFLSSKKNQPVFLYPSSEEGKAYWVAHWEMDTKKARLFQEGGILAHVGAYGTQACRYHDALASKEVPRLWLIVSQTPQAPPSLSLDILFPHLKDTPFTNSFIEIGEKDLFYDRRCK